MPREDKMKMTEQEKFILEITSRCRTVTNWHWNDDFLDFWERFCSSEKNIRKVQRSFRYYANKLVERGFLEKARRVGLGWGGYSEFGTRTQTIWELKKKEV